MRRIARPLDGASMHSHSPAQRDSGNGLTMALVVCSRCGGMKVQGEAILCPIDHLVPALTVTLAKSGSFHRDP